MQADINVVLVGYGMAGKILHAPLISATPGLALRGVVSSDPVKVAADWPQAQVVSFDQALADPQFQLVVLATPDHLHGDQAKAVLAAGKHVVVDKPFAVSLAQAREVAQVAEAAKGILSIFQNRRWDGDFLTIRRLIAQGALGEVVQFKSYYNRFRPVPVDVWKERREGGVWQDLGPHLVDQALQLFGPPIAVYADIATQKRDGPGGDYVHALLRYPRLRVILHAGQMTADSDLRFAVHGELGSYVKYGMDTQEVGLKAGLRPGSPGWGAEARPGRLTPVVDNLPGEPRSIKGEAGDYPAYYAALRDAIRGLGPVPAGSVEALNTMRVLEAGWRSAETHREIALDEV